MTDPVIVQKRIPTENSQFTKHKKSGEKAGKFESKWISLNQICKKTEIWNKLSRTRK